MRVGVSRITVAAGGGAARAQRPVVARAARARSSPDPACTRSRRARGFQEALQRQGIEPRPSCSNSRTSAGRDRPVAAAGPRAAGAPGRLYRVDDAPLAIVEAFLPAATAGTLGVARARAADGLRDPASSTLGLRVAPRRRRDPLRAARAPTAVAPRRRADDARARDGTDVVRDAAARACEFMRIHIVAGALRVPPQPARSDRDRAGAASRRAGRSHVASSAARRAFSKRIAMIDDLAPSLARRAGAVALGASPRRGAFAQAYPEPHAAPHRAVPGRRPDRHRRAAARAAARRRARADGRRRQPRRRRRLDRRRRRRARRARRLHAADGHRRHARDQRSAVQEAAVRPGAATSRRSRSSRPRRSRSSSHPSLPFTRSGRARRAREGAARHDRPTARPATARRAISTGELFKRGRRHRARCTCRTRAARRRSTDLLGGQIPLMFDPLQSVLPHVQSGKLRALAVSSARARRCCRMCRRRRVGLEGFELTAWWGVFAPAKLPADVAAAR